MLSTLKYRKCVVYTEYKVNIVIYINGLFFV